jgi:outer membrane receptor protein involved in Fe transport
MHRNFTQLGRIAAILAVGTVGLVAQGTQTCSITGSVIEGGKGAVAGATVTLKSPSLQGVRVLRTDDNGRFASRLLPPGLYTITITKDGLQTRTVTEKIGVDQNYQPTFTLARAAGAVVEVIATSTAVDKTDVKTSTNYSLDTVDRLPTVNRSMETVALLTPGVVSGVGGRVQIRGAMTNGNLYLVDGQNVSDNAYGNRGSRLIEDAIEETQLITGAISAEYGSVDGGVINSVTRSGGNTFTGQIRDEVRNPQWNAMKPAQARESIINQLSEEKTYSLGGFFIKDKLWFYTSYFRTSTNTASTLSTNGALGALAGKGDYNYNKEEIRRQIKLTWLITQDHTLVYSWMNSQNNENLRDYSAGELEALIPQGYKDSLYNVALRSVWSSALTTDIRFGQKKQTFNGGPSTDGSIMASPIYDDVTGCYYGHGVFNGKDGGDNRDNHTANIKASMFWDGMGTHQTDAGFDYYEGVRRARNEQSTSGYILEVDNLSYRPIAGSTANYGTPSARWVYESGAGKATTTTTGIYFNDKWSLNNKLSLQLGLRWDKYSAKSDTGISTVSATGWSPRIGMKYDLLGDSVWVFGLSWARYNSGVTEGITTQVTRQGNPKEIDYFMDGTAGHGPITSANPLVNGRYDLSDPLAAIWNPANYSRGADNVAWYGNPSLNVKLADNLKAPHVDETQLSAAYSFKSEAFGDGFLRLTYVNKEWHDLLDYIQGPAGNGTPSGTITDVDAGFTAYMKVWGNSKVAKRKYHDLELDGQATKGAWMFGGNITWARSEGNFEGEGTSTPSRGEGLQAWTITDIPGRRISFDPAVKAPYGALTGDTPLRMRLTASYIKDNAWGKTTVGFIYRFDSGAHFSLGRNITPGQIDPGLNGLGAGTYFTQYYGNERGQFVAPGTAFLDMSITQDFELCKVAGTPVKAFAKMVITNVLNHQQIISWNTTIKNAVGTSTSATTALNSPWIKSSSAFWNPTTASNFGAARGIVASVGVRF